MRAEVVAVVLALLCAGGGAAAEPEQRFALDARLGAGVSSNLTRSALRSQQAALARVAVEADLEMNERLHLDFSGSFVEYLPQYSYNETSLRQLLSYRQPLGTRWAVRPGCLVAYDRQLTNFVLGYVLTTGAVLVAERAGRCALAGELRLGPVDLEAGAEGSLRSLDGVDAMDVLGVDAYAAVRWVPTRSISLRARYLYIFENIAGMRLYDLDGRNTNEQRDVRLGTHRVELGLRAHPAESIDLVAWTALAFARDNYRGYLTDREVHALAAVYVTRRIITGHIEGRALFHEYPLRRPTAGNQVADLELSAVAEAALWPWRHWGLFGRYEFDGELANPFGALYFRHVALAGVAARTEILW